MLKNEEGRENRPEKPQRMTCPVHGDDLKLGRGLRKEKRGQDSWSSAF